MGIGQDDQQLQRKKMEQILHQETRVATNLNETKEGYDQHLYNIEQTKKDKTVINELLQSKTLQISNKEKFQLMAIQGRNISHLLINQNQYDTDSPEMAAVKTNVATLEQLLNNQSDNAASPENILEVESAYKAAIASCRYYRDHKNPTFQSGTDRKNMVIETLSYLEDEARQLALAKELISTGKLMEQAKCARDLIIQVREYMEQKKQQDGAGSAPQRVGLNSLTYNDFAAMLGTHNRGQIEYSDGGLKFINNGILSFSSGTASVQNHRLRERLFFLAAQKLGEGATPEVLLGLRKTLGLDPGNDNGVDTKSLPLSRRGLFKVLAVVNEKTSVVDQVRANQTNASDCQISLAKYTDMLLGSETTTESRLHSTPEQEQKLKTEIAQILGKAKQAGVEVPGLSKHQMDNLVKGNLPLLRSFRFLHPLCGMLLQKTIVPKQ